MSIIYKLLTDLNSLEEEIKEIFRMTFENLLMQKLYSIQKEHGKAIFLGKIDECQSIDSQIKLLQELENSFLRTYHPDLFNRKDELNILTSLEYIYRYYKFKAFILCHEALREIVFSVDPNDEIEPTFMRDSAKVLDDREQLELYNYIESLKVRFSLKLVMGDQIKEGDLKKIWGYAQLKLSHAGQKNYLSEKDKASIIPRISYKYFKNLCFSGAWSFLADFVNLSREQLNLNGENLVDAQGKFSSKTSVADKTQKDLSGYRSMKLYVDRVVKSCLPLLEEGELTEVRERLVCPISLESFKDPVRSPSGQTFDRASIEDWLIKQGNTIDPITRLPLYIYMLTQDKDVAELQSKVESNLEARSTGSPSRRRSIGK